MYKLIGLLIVCLCFVSCKTTSPLDISLTTSQRAEIHIQTSDGAELKDVIAIQFPSYEEFEGLEASAVFGVTIDSDGKVGLGETLVNIEHEALKAFTQLYLPKLKFKQVAGKSGVMTVSFLMFSDIETGVLLSEARHFEEEGQNDMALTMLSQIVPADQNLYPVLILKAEILSNLERYEESIEYYSRAIEQSPGNERGYYSRAFRLRQIKAYDLALADLKRSLSLNATHWETYQLLSSTSQMAGNFLDAIKFATLGMKHRSDDYFFTKRGWLYLNNENYQLALSDFKKALELNERNGENWSGLARAYFDLERYQDALTAAQHAVELDGENTYDLNLLGLIYGELKNYEASSRFYRKVIEHYEPNDLTYNNLGWNYIIQGKYQEAIKTYEQQVIANRGSSRQRYNMATAYYLMGDYSAALGAFERAMAQDDDDLSFGHAWMARIYTKLNQLQKAMESMSYVMKHDPEYYDGLHQETKGEGNFLPDILTELKALAVAKNANGQLQAITQWEKQL